MKDLKNLIYIAFNNLKRENKSSSLGFVWLLFNPIIEAITYGLIFGVFYPAQEEGIDKLPWIIVGVFSWSFLSRGFLSAMDSLYNNKHLVTKIKFPLSHIPIIHIIMEFMRYLLLWCVMLPILWYFKIWPSISYIYIFYCSVASVAFLISISRLFLVIGTLVKDISNLVNALFGILFWLSGVILNPSAIEHTFPKIYFIIKLNPFEHLLSTWRKAFISSEVTIFTSDLKFTLLFWVITICTYLVGTFMFNKFKGDFADII